MPRPFFGMSSGFFLSFFALFSSALVGSMPKIDETTVGSEDRSQQTRLFRLKLGDVCARIIRRRHGRPITSRRSPIDARRDVAHDDLAVAVLRHVSIGHKLAVTRNLRGQESIATSRNPDA